MAFLKKKKRSHHKGAYLLKGAILFLFTPSVRPSISFFGPRSLILIRPTVGYSRECLFSRQSQSRLCWRDGEEEEDDDKEEEEEEEGAVFDKSDSQTQTHAQRESYCLDPGGFSIQQ